MSKVKLLAEADFDKEVLGSSEPVMVDFSADWCRPCKTLEPIIEQLSEEVPHKVFKVDIDECATLSKKFGIKSVPTIAVFKDGTLVKSFVGVTTLANLKKLFE